MSRDRWAAVEAYFSDLLFPPDAALEAALADSAAAGLPAIHVSAAQGRLLTLELDRTHAEIARRNFERAGVLDRIDLRVGPALETLRAIETEASGPFDFIFVDADKPAYLEYLEWSIRLSRPGTVIVVDNIVREGEVVNSESTDVKVQGVRRFNAALAKETRVTATAIQLVSAKSYDGFAVMIVKAA
jgi:predicted O-methyltransferase YrrM